MAEIMLYVGGILGIFSMILFCSWILDKVFESDDYRNHVTTDDLAEMARLFDKEGSFVGLNDKGEKFYCGYMKD